MAFNHASAKVDPLALMTLSSFTHKTTHKLPPLAVRHSERVEKAYASSFFTRRQAIRWIIATLTQASLLAVIPS
jgi:hypothetical protein